MTRPAANPLRLLVASALFFGPAAGLSAQIGALPGQMLERYGRPLLANTNAIGLQTLTYRKDNIDITAFGREGVALRVVYHKSGLRAQDVLKLLELNRGAASWTVWTPPDKTAPQDPPSAWMRSDDQAMAVREGDTLTVTAGAWNQVPNEESAASTPARSLLLRPAPEIVPLLAPRLSPRPREKARPPAELPGPGESRAQVCRLLGRPRGEISRGPREILLFDWGLLELEHGRVVKVN